MSQFAPRDSEWDMNAKARGKELEFNERAAGERQFVRNRGQPNNSLNATAGSVAFIDNIPVAAVRGGALIRALGPVAGRKRKAETQACRMWMDALRDSESDSQAEA